MREYHLGEVQAEGPNGHRVVAIGPPQLRGQVDHNYASKCKLVLLFVSERPSSAHVGVGRPSGKGGALNTLISREAPSLRLPSV